MHRTSPLTLAKREPHVPLVRRLLSGRKVPKTYEGPRPAVVLGAPVRPNPSPANLRARALFAHVPEPLRVVTPPSEVPGTVPGQPRRRERRAAARRRRSTTLRCSTCGVFVAGSGAAAPQVGEPCEVCESQLQDGWLQAVSA